MLEWLEIRIYIPRQTACMDARRRSMSDCSAVKDESTKYMRMLRVRKLWGEAGGRRGTRRGNGEMILNYMQMR